MGTGQNTAPFDEAHQLNRELDGSTNSKSTPSLSSKASYDHLPGFPQISLSETASLAIFLTQELCAPDLEIMAPHLWMLSTASSENVHPLHHQRVKGRDILVSEKPQLHLVWIYDRIFVKPMPKYLLSFSFWQDHLLSDTVPLPNRDNIRRSALGYLRTYRYLIKHESDFAIAKRDDLRLLPEDVSWPQFCKFISRFDDILDSEVSLRYSYGELRLTRLNFYGRFILHRAHFEYLHGQYSTYFGRFYGPLLFVFGVLSIMLSAMQLEMAAETLVASKWTAFWLLSRWFGTVCFGGTACIAILLFCLLIWKIGDEWVYALMARKGSKTTNPTV
jgi:hypothetical protein